MFVLNNKTITWVEIFDRKSCNSTTLLLHFKDRLTELSYTKNGFSRKYNISFIEMGTAKEVM